MPHRSEMPKGETYGAMNIIKINEFVETMFDSDGNTVTKSVDLSNEKIVSKYIYYKGEQFFGKWDKETGKVKNNAVFSNVRAVLYNNDPETIRSIPLNRVAFTCLERIFNQQVIQIYQVLLNIISLVRPMRRLSIQRSDGLINNISSLYTKTNNTRNVKDKSKFNFYTIPIGWKR